MPSDLHVHVDAGRLPRVSVAKVLDHLLWNGKGSKDDVTVVQKPLGRGHEFFFAGYVYDVRAARLKS